jgi:alpha-N-arabinofuranosidase
MKTRWFLSMILILTLSTVQAQNQISLTIHADQPGAQISRHIYGHFSEHLGRCIYEGLWVGEDSDIPNVHGCRKDVMETLKEIGIPNLRWPGGCFADTYHWKDGIGPREDRPEIVNVHWGGVTEDNSFGTHEFMGLCELLECEPVICGNVGSGTVQEMAEWVEYLTSGALSPMTRLRKANGREEPWKVKFWGVGNETWGCGGTMTAEFYSDQLRRYATFCRDYGNNRLFRVACGASTDDYGWTETLMREWRESPDWVKGYMQGLSLHYYTVCHDWSRKGSATEFTEADWFLTMSKTLYMEEIVTKHSAIMDQYDPEKSIALIVDEWGNWHDVEPGTNPGFLYQQNTLRDALVAGINLNIFNNHADRVKMANIAQVVNVLQSMVLTQKDQMVRTPTWHVFKMFLPHHDATLLPVEFESPVYQYGEETIPAVTASASRDAKDLVHLSLTNADPKQSHVIFCKLAGVKIQKVQGQIITADQMNRYNEFGKAESVFIQPFEGVSIQDDQIMIKLPPKSVVMVSL